MVILADDLGFSDIGCYGGEIETPHIDALAKNGLRFTNFYNAARCCPTRAALLTGLHPHQAGIGHMVANGGVPSYQGFLNEHCITLAEALKPAGYANLTTGKWHVGSAPEHWPLQRGFDRFWGTPLGGGLYFKETRLIRPEAIFVNGSQPVDPPDDMYVTDDFTDRAMEFIDEAVTKSKQPFFLYLAHIAPHWPLQAKPEDIGKYAGRYDGGWDRMREQRFARQKEMGIIPQYARLSPRDPKAKAWDTLPEERRKELARRMEIYAAQVDSLDQNIGRIVDKLKQIGQYENTLILFLSDNGCSAEGGPGGFSRGLEGAKIGTARSYASAGLEWANACNTPFRKYKANAHEGGIATPLVVHWPRGIAARGEMRTQTGHVIDFMPTLLDLTGAKYPKMAKDKDILPLEGQSLLPAFGEAEPRLRQLFWEHEGSGAVRDGDWKLVRSGAKGAWELYHLANDPTELDNVAAEHPARVKSLSDGWEKWARRVGAKPFHKASSNTHGPLINETHKASLLLRENALRETIAKDSCWPGGVWGDNLWTLSALFLNEKTDAANASLLRRANEYIALKRSGETSPVFRPESENDTPWSYFSLTDYVRCLCLFGAKSPHFPERLNPETEAAMKEALWIWVSASSRVDNAGMDDLFLLLGTENHDLSLRPNHYLITALLNDDPAYQERKLADGHSVSEHAAAYTAFFREWPRRRAASGMWIEVGSNTYQKYSWPALFNLHELAPDPVIRHRFGLLLDLAFVEEAQISVKGRRGGGRSRGSPGANGFESCKNLLFARSGQPAGSGHSRVIETSRYQLPAAAILLDRKAVQSSEPFVIRNRVLGELEAGQSSKDGQQRMESGSALVNYAYRTPCYLLGSTLQNPALGMKDPLGGVPILKYAGISRQNRSCGLLFDDTATAKPSGVHVNIEHPGGGRPQHSFWSVQHENVLIIQRIARHGKSTLGSYNTGRIGILFDGDKLTKIEWAGWIFATNGKAFVGVKFLDGPHQWDEKRRLADPANFTGSTDTSRILLHAGDLASHASFEDFQQALLGHPLNVTTGKVDYRFGRKSQRVEMTRYDSAMPESFMLPLINGEPIDLRPASVYESPYLNGAFGDARISVSVGPINQIVDFSKEAL